MPFRMNLIQCFCPTNPAYQEIAWKFKIERETWKDKYLQEDDHKQYQIQFYNNSKPKLYL